MQYIDFTVVEPGSDIAKVESILLEQFGRFEATSVRIVERPLHARVGSAYSAIRYRVYTDGSWKVKNRVVEVVDRLRSHSNSKIYVVEGYVAVLEVDKEYKRS